MCNYIVCTCICVYFPCTHFALCSRAISVYMYDAFNAHVITRQRNGGRGLTYFRLQAFCEDGREQHHWRAAAILCQEHQPPECAADPPKRHGRRQSPHRTSRYNVRMRRCDPSSAPFTGYAGLHRIRCRVVHAHRCRVTAVRGMEMFAILFF